jgi:hypothetical protein
MVQDVEGVNGGGRVGYIADGNSGPGERRQVSAKSTMNGWMVGRRLPRRERGRQQDSWGAGLSRRGKKWCAGRRGWWTSKKGKKMLIARPGHLGGSERGAKSVYT